MDSVLSRNQPSFGLSLNSDLNELVSTKTLLHYNDFLSFHKDQYLICAIAPVFIHILSVMLHLSIEASVAAALGGTKVLLEGSNLALCEVKAGRILVVVFGDSVVVVLIAVLGVLECLLAADDWVVLI